MKFGVHLPLIAFGEPNWSLSRLRDYVRTARELGYTAMAANDHLVFPRAWLDGPTALAAVLGDTGDTDLMTTVTLPVVRGPLQTAKTLAAIDVLSGGRLIVGVGAGSSEVDYRSVGIDFEERWKRMDEAIHVLRALWSSGSPPFEGRFYSTAQIVAEPRPARDPLPIWIGSWGSDAGLRRVVRLGDGWLASGYNTTPTLFGRAWEQLQERLRDANKSVDEFPNAIATMWMFISEDGADADRVLGALAEFLHRPREDLRERLLVGSPAACAAKLTAYREAGVQRVLLWPVVDEIAQIELFVRHVEPLVGDVGRT